mgnify:CR=1 FL=1
MSWNFEELTDGDVATCFSDLASKLNTLSRAAAATAKLMTRDQAGDTARGVFFLRDDSAPLPATAVTWDRETSNTSNYKANCQKVQAALNALENANPLVAAAARLAATNAADNPRMVSIVYPRGLAP